MVTVELLPDSALVALRRFCAIQMAVIIIIIIIIKNAVVTVARNSQNILCSLQAKILTANESCTMTYECVLANAYSYTLINIVR